MALTSLFGGMALANAGLGAVHGLAGPLGGMLTAPHGALCARLLPTVMAVNVQALKARSPDSEALRRYQELARILTGQPNATAADGIAWVKTLTADLGIPSLSSYGLTCDNYPELIEKAHKASSMKSNPITLTPDELTQIVDEAL